MQPPDQADVLRLAAIVAMEDGALAERIAYLRGVTDDPLGDDNLTGAGWQELSELEDERDRRASPRCGLCGRRGPLPAGQCICASCAFFPLD